MKPKTMKRLLALPEAQQEKVLKQARDRLRNKPPQAGEPAPAIKPVEDARPDDQKSAD